MHRRWQGNKNPQTKRFTLLLLEDGEFFLDDHRACRYLEPKASSHKKVSGRLKVCTRGLFFVPQDLQLPILRFPFRSMTFEPLAECFVPSKTSENVAKDATFCQVYFTFKTKQVIEMREGGIDHPYIYRETTTETEHVEREKNKNDNRNNRKKKVPAKYLFTLQHVTLDAFLATIHILYEVSTSTIPQRMMTKAEEEQRLAPVLAPRVTDTFDSSLLVDFRERLLLEKASVANRIEPLLTFPGCLMLTTHRLYFQPAPINNVLDPVLNWEYTTINQIYKRRYLLQQVGLEIYVTNNDSFFFSFRSQTERDALYAILVAQPALQHCHRQDLQVLMQQWQRREISNFEYLFYLNNASGRTLNDLTQYPVFPWILCDYTSPELNLEDPKVYRDLTKPIGALNQERLEYFKTRYNVMPRGDKAEGIPPPFLYGTHYSTPGYVLYFLVRKVPQYILCLQSGKFDAPDRLFRSIQTTWEGCLSNPTDVKELIPEFFDCTLPAGEWLNNSKHLELGTTQTLDRVDDVVLPPWAHGDANEFVEKNRAALESDYVSANLHHWIDLIFGYKQQGEEAVKANNLFYYLSYEGSVDLQAIDDPVEKSSLEAQIQEFGQTPKVLFSTPHPSRNEGRGQIQVATPDLLVSPRVVIPPIHAVSCTGTSVLNLQHRRDIVNEYAESEDEKEGASMPNRYQSHRKCPFVCFFPNFWNSFRTAGWCFPYVWRRIRRIQSGKPVKKWKWRSRLQAKYSASSTSWSWKQIAASQVHQGEVTSTGFSKDGSFLVTSGRDGSLKYSSTYNVATCHEITSEFALSCCELSPDETLVLVGSWDNSVYMYSVSTGLLLDKVLAHSDGISAIRVLQDHFVTSSWDSTIKFWRYTLTNIVAVPIRTFLNCEESVLCLDVTRDGRFGAAGTRKGSIYLFHLSTAVLQHRVEASAKHRGGISAISFARDNKSYICVTVQSELIHFNLQGEEIWRMDIYTGGQIRCLESDGIYAVGGTTAGKILFWKLHAEAGTELVYELPQAHDQSISSLAVSSSGSMLVSGAVDGSVHVWNLRKKLNAFSQPSWKQSSVVQYSCIQTTSAISSSSVHSFKQKSKTRRHFREYIPNFTMQLAEAECCLEF